MAKIACDLDGTLYNFEHKVKDEFFKMSIERDDKSILRAAYTPHTEWRSLSDSADKDLTYEAILRVHDQVLDQVPFDGACDTLWELVDSGHEIVYIGSRLEKYHDITVAWLAWHGFPQPKNLVCVQGDKIPHIRDCKYLIDDRPRTVIDFVKDFVWQNWWGSEIGPENKRKAFGIHTPYNSGLTDVENVFLAPSWIGVRYYLKRKGIITV